MWWQSTLLISFSLVDILQTLPTLNMMWLLNTKPGCWRVAPMGVRRVYGWCPHFFDKVHLRSRLLFFTHRNGDDNWAFDDPPIGGVLIYVPTPAEESASVAATEFGSAFIGYFTRETQRKLSECFCSCTCTSDLGAFVYVLRVLEINSGSDPQCDEEHGNAWRRRQRLSQPRHKAAWHAWNALKGKAEKKKTPVWESKPGCGSRALSDITKDHHNSLISK